MQWAAVTTHFWRKSVPPQMCFSLTLSSRLQTYGNLPTGASTPYKTTQNTLSKRVVNHGELAAIFGTLFVKLELFLFPAAKKCHCFLHQLETTDPAE